MGRRHAGWGRLTLSVLLAECEQFFVECADLPRAIYEVNLENPVSLAPFRVRVAHAVRIVRVHVQGDLVSRNAFLRKLANEMPGDSAAKFLAEVLGQFLGMAIELDGGDVCMLLKIFLTQT
jgi:hypothetical protein